MIEVNSILPSKNTNPYYILAPRYVETSAGIVALYMLCHHLNRKGLNAYIVIIEENWQNHKISSGLLCPILSEEIILDHQINRKTPIFVYPESVKGDIFQARNIARFVMNYPGLLGGDNQFSSNELIFSYSRQIAQKCNFDVSNVLFIPVSDSSIFYPPQDNSERKGTCVYLGKYTDFHGGKPFAITNNSTVITRQGNNVMSRKEMADLFRKSELLYLYENSAVAIEAALCGCPAVFIPNEYLKEKPLANYELGEDGYVFGLDKNEIEKAKTTVKLARGKFLESVDNFYHQLDDFIKKTQDKFAREYDDKDNGFYDNLRNIIHSRSTTLTPSGNSSIIDNINKIRSVFDNQKNKKVVIQVNVKGYKRKPLGRKLKKTVSKILKRS